MPIDPDQLRQALGRFASGVAIVTSRHGDRVHGSTMSAFCSASLDPPLVLVCVDRHAESHGTIAEGRVFAVNILKDSQDGLSATLARKGTPELEAAHRLDGVSYTTAVTGAPILQGIQAYLDCVLTQAIEAGDHTIYVGRIEDAWWDEKDRPLLYYRGRYGRFAG